MVGLGEVTQGLGSRTCHAGLGSPARGLSRSAAGGLLCRPGPAPKFSFPWDCQQPRHRGGACSCLSETLQPDRRLLWGCPMRVQDIPQLLPPPWGHPAPTLPRGCGEGPPDFTRWQSRLEQRHRHQSRLYWEDWFLLSAICLLVSLQGQTSSCPHSPLPRTPPASPQRVWVSLGWFFPSLWGSAGQRCWWPWVSRAGAAAIGSR